MDTGEKAACPRCKGVGWLRRNVPYGHPDFGRPVECACLKCRKRQKLVHDMTMLCKHHGLQRSQCLALFRPHLKGVQVAWHEIGRLIEHLHAWVTQMSASPDGPVPSLPQEWLILCGPVGTGKTHLAMALANACLDAGILTLFATVPDLLDRLRAAYAPNSEVLYDELFERMKQVELLVLDDLGTQRSSPWADEKLFQLLNHRYVCRLPTAVTLNQQAWMHLDERLRSRLQDASLVRLVSLAQAQDYRLSQGRNVSRPGM